MFIAWLHVRAALSTATGPNNGPEIKSQDQRPWAPFRIESPHEAKGLRTTTLGQTVLRLQQYSDKVGYVRHLIRPDKG